MWKIEVLCVQSGSTLNVVLRWETSRSLSWCPAPRTPAAPPPLPAAAAAAPAGRVSIGDILAGPPVALPPLHPVTHVRPAALPVTRPVPLDAAPCASLADSRRRGEPPGVGDPRPHPSRGPSLPPALCPAPKTFLPHLSSRPGTFHPLLPAPGTLFPAPVPGTLPPASVAGTLPTASGNFPGSARQLRPRWSRELGTRLPQGASQLQNSAHCLRGAGRPARELRPPQPPGRPGKPRARSCNPDAFAENLPLPRAPRRPLRPGSSRRPRPGLSWGAAVRPSRQARPA